MKKFYTMTLSNLFNFADDYVRNLRPFAQFARLVFMTYVLELEDWKPCADGIFARFKVGSGKDLLFSGTFSYKEDGTINWVFARKERKATQWLETFGISAIAAANNALWEARQQEKKEVKKTYLLDRNREVSKDVEALPKAAEESVDINLEKERNMERVVLEGTGNYVRKKSEWTCRGHYDHYGNWIPPKTYHSSQPVGVNYKNHRIRKEEM